MKAIQSLRFLRSEFFNRISKNRIHRILVCTLVIGSVWMMADAISGSVSVNLWHDALCLALGIFAERLIPWGKQDVTTV